MRGFRFRSRHFYLRSLPKICQPPADTEEFRARKKKTPCIHSKRDVITYSWQLGKSRVSCVIAAFLLTDIRVNPQANVNFKRWKLVNLSNWLNFQLYASNIEWQSNRKKTKELMHGSQNINELICALVHVQERILSCHALITHMNWLKETNKQITKTTINRKQRNKQTHEKCTY